MNIEYREGNLLESDLKFIAHGCNACGVMGSGIAKAIREKYPEAYNVYRKQYINKGLKLGSVIQATISDFCSPETTSVVPLIPDHPAKIIFNCITQATYGRDPSVRYVDYDAVFSCVQEINRRFSELTSPDWPGENLLAYFNVDYKTPEVGFPMIGAGLGNGDWHVISAIIEEASTHFKPIVYLFKDQDV